MSSKKYRKSAFTLAEVLVTLVVIGIVAALTLPSLMAGYQEKALRKQAKVAYSLINQALNSYKMEESPDLVNEYTGNFGFKFRDTMANYFKIIDDCNGARCVPYTVTSTVYKTLNGNDAVDTQYNGGSFVISNGMTVFFDDVYLNIFVDVNGHRKKPNKYGVDFFVFELNRNDFTLKPMGASGTTYTSSNYCDQSSSNSMNGFSCTVKAVQDIDY